MWGFWAAIFKMAATTDTLIIFDGANYGFVAQAILYDSAKFDSFMTKCTLV